MLPTLLLALTLSIPRAAAPTIDGTINAAEWKSATRVALTNGGEAFLLHDGKFLYVAIRSPQAGIGSLCIASKADVRILHASAALGTAIFRDDVRTRDFTWTNRDTGTSEKAMTERKRFLETEGWFANSTPRATREREYQIRMNGAKELPLTIAFLSFEGNQRQLHVWPPSLSDSCASTDLAAGHSDASHTFDTSQWAVVALTLR